MTSLYFIVSIFGLGGIRAYVEFLDMHLTSADQVVSLWYWRLLPGARSGLRKAGLGRIFL